MAVGLSNEKSEFSLRIFSFLLFVFVRRAVMATTLLEQTRSLHEDIERFEQIITALQLEKLKTVHPPLPSRTQLNLAH